MNNFICLLTLLHDYKFPYITSTVSDYLISIGEKALIDFLAEEIEAEKASLADHLPSQINGFQIKYDGAEVELSKQSSSEKYVTFYQHFLI